MPVSTPELGRSARKRQLILEAATSSFLSRGYDGTSMDDVAALAAVSKPTVYKHFADKERLFYEIVLATTEPMRELVQLIADAFGDARDLQRSLRQFAHQFIDALMQPDVLRLRRLVIANADRFPEMGRAWYAHGFERVLAALADEFRRLTDLQLLHADDPVMAANHLVGLLLWIPVNKVMFSGDAGRSSTAELQHYADAAVDAFLRAYAGGDHVAHQS
jgi:TetR/AcrR family transcriptional regulator, mexJK operon transcriptional repressor